MSDRLDGVYSVLPAPFAATRILHASEDVPGRLEEAADRFYRTVALMRVEFQEGIGMAIRKEVLRRRGALATAATRQPGPSLDETTREALDRVLPWVGAQAGGRWISV